MDNNIEKENLAQTLARELKAPAVLLNEDALATVAVPPGWKVEKVDREELLEAPRRIKTSATLTNKQAFVDYVTRHDDVATVWSSLDAVSGKVSFLAILDDHLPVESGVGDRAAWRSHRAGFTPEFSVEWKRWNEKNGEKMSQTAFAAFLEDNLKDVAGATGLPDGGAMLAMALDFQARESQKFRSAIRQQSGAVRMEFVVDEDKNTVEAMQVFERFQIAIPVFRDDTVRYPITSRLRYRCGSGGLVFWYELIRADLVFEESSKALIEFIRAGCALPFFFGNPG